MSSGLVREKPNNWLVGKTVTVSWESGRVPEGAFLEILGYRVGIYGITSMARTRMARLPWMIRTLFSVPTKYFQ